MVMPCFQSSFSAVSLSTVALLARLEQLSRNRPDRVLRLRGVLPVSTEAAAADPAAAVGLEPFELLIFRGFSSSVTHPTGFDPDRPLLPEGSRIEAAELLAGPLNPTNEQLLAGPEPVEHFLRDDNWG
jgi:hypothetical protein